MDCFRLTYLKSPGLEKGFEASSSSYGSGQIASSSVPSPGDHIPETLSSEAVLKQAKADLRHPDPQVRILAIRYYLEKSFPSIPLSLLQEILSDRDPDVRAQALRALVKFRNPIVSPLLKKYLKDSDSRVRIAALRGMFQFQEKIDLNIFIQFLSDESTWVRRKLATLLGWAQIEGALPILKELSRDVHSTVRRAALFSLATLYPDEGEHVLIEAMTDPDPELRKWAKTTLENLLTTPSNAKTTFLTTRG
ncbi:MAG: lyase domain protein repeat-containing protein [Deltaproteobacteria bacterium]|nr:lyase domain protein repeat-containing protein [Deltaproteobacteria bacterium]